MKKRTIVSLCASLLSLGVIGTSVALYSKFDAPIEIGITGSVSDDGTYRVEKKSEVNATEFAPGKNYQASYELGLDKTEGSTYTQDSVIANVTITFTMTGASETETASTIWNALELNIGINGFAQNTFFNTNKQTFNKEKFKVSGSNEEIYSFSQDVVFSVGSQAEDDGILTNTLDLDISTSDESFLTVAEKSFSYTISVTHRSASYEVAYIAGDFNGWSQNDDYYQMVPCLDSEQYTWCYKGLNIQNTEFQFRAVKGQTWSGDENQKAPDGTGYYDVEWNGGTGYENGLILKKQ